MVKPLAGKLTQQQVTWLEGHLAAGCRDYQALATFLIGISKSGYEYPEEHYAAMSFAEPVPPLPTTPSSATGSKKLHNKCLEVCGTTLSVGLGVQARSHRFDFSTPKSQYIVTYTGKHFRSGMCKVE